MNDIENRIVQMRFVNDAFEGAAKTTIKTLQLLKKSMDMTESAKGFDDVDKAINRFSLGSIMKDVSTLTDRFDRLGLIGAGALMRIGSEAVEYGAKMLKALTIEPVLTGLNEYELKMNSIQTILTNTERYGSTIDDVSEALNELNLYADRTIYNFQQMTQAVGMFTTAGVDLETSTSAVKGISNLAAYVGAPADDASRAMFQLSQALSTGSVRLQDWMSIEHTAGMGGKAFQEALQRTAEVVYGMDVQGLIDHYGNFRETLKEGWLTTEVLTETLKQFAGEVDATTLAEQGFNEEQIESILLMGKRANEAATVVKTYTQLVDTLKEAAQSGWAESWEIIIGNLEDSKELWTSVSEEIGGILDAQSQQRNDMLREWREEGGRDALLNSIANIWKALLSIIIPVKEAFREIFPPITGKQLAELTKHIENLTSKLIISDNTAELLKGTFKGLFSIVSIGTKLFSIVFKVISLAMEPVQSLIKFILLLGNTFSSLTIFINEAILSAENIGEVFSSITNYFDNLKNAGKQALENLSPTFQFIGSLVDDFKQKLLNLSSSEGFSIFLDKILQLLGMLGEGFKKVTNWVVEFIASLTPQDLLDAGATTFITLLAYAIKRLVDILRKFASGGVDIMESFNNILLGVKDVLKAYQMEIKANIIIKIAKALAILAVSLVLIASIPADKIATTLATFTVVFTELGIMMLAMGVMIDAFEFTGIMSISAALIGIAASVLVLSVAMKQVADLEWESIGKGLVVITAASGLMLGVTVLLRDNEAKFSKGIMSIFVFASAVKKLVQALIAVSNIEQDKMIVSLSVVATLIAMIGVFSAHSNIEALNMKNAIALNMTVMAITAMVLPLKILSALRVDEIIVGLTAMGAILFEIGMFSRLLMNSSGILQAAVAMPIIALGLDALTVSLYLLGSLPFDKAIKGLGVMGTLLLEISIALTLLRGTITGATSLIIVSGALALLTPQLALLSAIPSDALIKALLGIGAALAIFCAAGMLVAPVAPVILALGASLLLASASFAVFGFGIVSIAAGITAFVAAFNILTSATPAGIALMIKSFELLLQTLVNLIPTIISSVITLALSVTIGIVEGLAREIPRILNGVLVILTAILEAIVKFAPRILEAILSIIQIILNAVEDHIDDIMATVVRIMIKIIGILRDYTVPLVNAATELIIALINGLANSIREYTPQLIDAMNNLLSAIIEAILSALQRLLKHIPVIGDKIDNALEDAKSIVKDVLAPEEIEKIGSDAGKGLEEGLRSQKDDVYSAGEEVSDSANQGIMSRLKEEFQFGAETGEEYADGILSTKKDAENSGSELSISALTGTSSNISLFEDAGESSASGFALGMQNKMDLVKSVGFDLGKMAITATKIALDSNSPSKEYEKIGKDVDTGLAIGIDKNSKIAEDSAENLGDNVIESTKDSMDDLSSELEDMMFGADAVQVYINKYSELNDEFRTTRNVVDEAKNAITAYGFKLYAQSDQYSKDTEKMEEYRTKLEELNETRDELNESIANGGKETDKTLKELQSELEKTEKDIDSQTEKIVEHTETMLDNVAQAYENYRIDIANSIRDTIDPLKQSLDTQIDIFSEFNSYTELTKEEILYNMESQVNGVKKWSEDLSKLGERGVSVGLLEKLKEMGPQSAEYVNAFMEMTNSELEKANEMFSETTAMTADTLIDNFEDSLNKAKEWSNKIQQLMKTGLDPELIQNIGEMGISGMDYLDAFLSMDESELEEFNNKYKEYLKLPDSVSNEVMATFAKAGASSSQSYVDEIKNYLNPEQNADIPIIMQEANELGIGITSSTAGGIRDTQPVLTQQAKTTGSETKKGFEKYLNRNTGSEIGRAMDNGLIAGINAGKSGVIAAAVATAIAAYKRAKAALDINSPSGKFEELGYYSDMGFAKGLINGINIVKNASNRVTNNMLDIVETGLEKFAAITDEKMDLSPKITPVVNLDEASSQLEKLNEMFNEAVFEESPLYRNASSISQNRSNSLMNGPQETVRDVSFNFEQNNYSPKALDKLTIYRQTKSQFASLKGVIGDI